MGDRAVQDVPSVIFIEANAERDYKRPHLPGREEGLS